MSGIETECGIEEDGQTVHLGLNLRVLSQLTLIQKDDQRVDAALPSGSTSKTWDPTQDHGVWSEDSSTQGPAVTSPTYSKHVIHASEAETACR